MENENISVANCSLVFWGEFLWSSSVFGGQLKAVFLLKLRARTMIPVNILSCFKSHTNSCVFPQLERWCVAAVGNFSELPALVDVFNSFVLRCVYLGWELLVEILWWVRSAPLALERLLKGLSAMKWGAGSSCQHSHVAQPGGAQLLPQRRARGLRYSMSTYLSGSQPPYCKLAHSELWCFWLRHPEILLMKPTWSVSGSDPEKWEYWTGFEPKGKLLLCFFPSSLPRLLRIHRAAAAISVLCLGDF